MPFRATTHKSCSVVSLLRRTACRLLVAGSALALAACGGSSSGGDATSATAYPLSGTISGLATTGLVLRNNGEDLRVAANATSFRFATDLAQGSAYAVTVAAQPAGLTCTVAHGTGSAIQAAVTNVAVVCNAITHTIAGTISGLPVAGLVLRNNGGDDLAIAANATTFQFSAPVAQGGEYAVSVATQPAGLICTVGHGSGAQVRADVVDIQVVCSTSMLGVSGTISGLVGSGLVLRNNSGDDLPIASNATTFEFATPVAYGGQYAVTVATQPAGQTCTPADASGTATTRISNIAITCVAIPVFTVTPSAGANGAISPASAQAVNLGGSITFVAVPNASYVVDQWLLDGNTAQSGGSVYNLNNVSANHTVTALFTQATLSLSTRSLALAVNDTSTNTALTGNPREIVVTNTGFINATNVDTNTAGLPGDTTISTSTCSGTLAPGSSCSVIITPGSTPTSNCGSGIAAVPGVLIVTADNANSSQAEIVVLTYGCIYQGGLLYAVDDTTYATSSIGGSVLALSDLGNLEWGGTGTAANAASTTDGAANTDAIVMALGNGNYAAQACSNFEVDPDGNSPCAPGTCYSDWHLPAICEWGYDGYAVGSGCGTAQLPLRQNVQSNLIDAAIPGLSSSPYWSSTEYAPNSNLNAWTYIPTITSLHSVNAKSDTTPKTRCARALTP